MRYVYAEDVIGTTSPFGGCRSCGGFGQSGSYSPAVAKLQRGLKAIAEETNNADYDPGKVDGAYGRNTHAALLRVSRDFLEPQGLVESTCRSTCNTLWQRAKSACAECLAQILHAYNDIRGRLSSGATSVGVSLGAMAGLGMTDSGEPEPLTDSEIEEIAGRYKEFLDAYVAKYGDGGVYDPLQIVRREGVDLTEAERLAEERRAAAEGAGPSTTTTTTSSSRQVQKAGFSWWWLLLFLGLGGAAWYAWRKGEGREIERTLPEDVTEYTGLGRRRRFRGALPPLSGCGCGG